MTIQCMCSMIVCHFRIDGDNIIIVQTTTSVCCSVGVVYCNTFSHSIAWLVFLIYMIFLSHWFVSLQISRLGVIPCQDRVLRQLWRIPCWDVCLQLCHTCSSEIMHLLLGFFHHWHVWCHNWSGKGIPTTSLVMGIVPVGFWNIQGPYGLWPM